MLRFFLLFAHLFKTNIRFQGIKTPLEMFAGTQCEIFCENSDFTEVVRPRVGQKLTSMHALSIKLLTISETNSLIAAHSFTTTES